jgi:hypothetical protein
MKKSMSKSKRTPEQEEETVEKNTATAAPEDDKDPPAEETPKNGKPEEETAEEKPEDAEDPKKDEETSKDKEQPKDDPEKAPVGPTDEVSEREAQLQTELLEARGQLAAYAAGVDPSKVGDAVILATAEAQKEGDLTEAGVTKAMANVLKRHPEWKTSGGDGKKSGSGGFKLGADPDKAGSGKKSGGKSNGNTKRWNRYK